MRSSWRSGSTPQGELEAGVAALIVPIPARRTEQATGQGQCGVDRVGLGGVRVLAFLLAEQRRRGQGRLGQQVLQGVRPGGHVTQLGHGRHATPARHCQYPPRTEQAINAAQAQFVHTGALIVGQIEGRDGQRAQ